jgi:hypothetical protein
MMYVVVSELRGMVKGPFPTYAAARSFIEKDLHVYGHWKPIELSQPHDGSFDPLAKQCDYYKENGTRCLRTAGHPVEGGLSNLQGHDFYI